MKFNTFINQCARSKQPAKTTRKHFIKPSLVALAVAQSLSIATVDAATIYVGGPQGAGCGFTGAIVSANNDQALASTNCVDGDGDDVIVLNRDIILRKPWQDTFFGVPTIESNITINGNGHTISRDTNAPNFSLFSVYSDMVLNDLTLSHGHGSDTRYHSDAITVGRGNLTINNSTISNNSGVGAISFRDMSAILTLNNTAISNNNGVGISVGATELNLNNSTISNNDDGIYESGSTFININKSSISNNEGTGLTNAFYSIPYGLNVIDSQFDDNGTGIDIGNGEFNATLGPIRIENSSISDNRFGGITLGAVETLEIIDSTISNNTSSRCAGLEMNLGDSFIYNGSNPVLIKNTIFSNNQALEIGGAACLNSSKIYHYSGSYIVGTAFPEVTILDSTFTNNSAGLRGGALVFEGPTSYRRYYSSPFEFVIDAPVTIVNSTFSFNSAGDTGGAISLGDPKSLSFPDFFDLGSHKLNLINSSIVNNSASDGGGIHTGDDGNNYLNISNSIIAGNSATNLGADINHLSALAFPAADLVDSKNNVLGSSTESNFQAFNGFTPSSTDITTTIDGSNPTAIDSIVGPLQDNGGSTLTHALVAGSPAIDAGDLDTCINEPVNGLDQRGETRDADGLCDIGAYEADNLNNLPSISIDSVEVSEGDNKARLTISLSSPQITRIPVDYQTVDGTANDGLDYTGRFGTMTFAPGQTQKIRVIQLNDDDLAEGTETFSLLLSNPVGATLAEAVGEVTVVDDDGFPTISIESDDHLVREGDSGNSRRIRYTITLSSALTERVTLDYQTMDESAIGGVDYEIRSGSMTFMPGQTSKIRSIRVLGDTEIESDETFRLILSNPSSNAELDVDEADSIGTILNDD